MKALRVREMLNCFRADRVVYQAFGEPVPHASTHIPHTTEFEIANEHD
jgi:hypothetical protein